MSKFVTAHDTILRCLTNGGLHPGMRKAEQVVWGEMDDRVITRVDDAPHRPAQVVVEPAVGRVSGLNIREDEVYVAQGDIRDKLAQFINCTCSLRLGSCCSQQLACESEVDPHPGGRFWLRYVRLHHTQLLLAWVLS